MEKVYLVGGAVRDAIMGKESHDLDYVVVGSSPEKMIAKGFKQVGADFPVFLHPETGDEYALARTERKTGNGYAGFETVFDETVTIEDDLSRRDLTINAIAQDLETGEFIDPFGGVQDIKDKNLKHVSDAFKEDPLRILRVARFYARFPDFKIDPTTMELMREIYDSGETKFLTKERIWKELSRAIIYTEGSKFFQVLQNVGMGKDLFPLIDGFKTDRNIDFTTSKVSAFEIDSRLNKMDLKDKIAGWSLSTYDVTDPNISSMWKSLSAPSSIVDHVEMSVSLWNNILKSGFKIEDLKKPSEPMYDLIKSHDGFRRTDRFIDAYSVVRNHFAMLSNNPKCFTDPVTVTEWIEDAKLTKDETKNVIANSDKKEIAVNMEKEKEKKWKKLSKSISPKFKY